MGKTPLFEWCNFIKTKVFSPDAESAYQFLYFAKRRWCRYLLECKNCFVRECLLDVIFAAIERILPLERPFYFLSWDPERNEKDEKVKWFASGSVVVALLDEMCKNILIATNYWRNFNEFWLFFLR